MKSKSKKTKDAKVESHSTEIFDHFPDNAKSLLSGKGLQFVERIGIVTVQETTLGILKGENLRKLTEPISRMRLAQISGALIKMIALSHSKYKNFTDELTNQAGAVLKGKKKKDLAYLYPAQWSLGLTGKSIQNVLSGDNEKLSDYITEFKSTLTTAAEKCEKDYGSVKCEIIFSDKQKAQLDWNGLAALTTLIGAQTLTIRGSEKSMYGKLFEKLVLGSVLSILGFELTDKTKSHKNNNVFWLSDPDAEREADATLLLEPGKIIRFDIGFIGPGNSEISKDKLSRYNKEVEVKGASAISKTIIIVDRLPATSKTKEAAKKINAEIIQMSMSFWPRTLAQAISKHFSVPLDINKVQDLKMNEHLEEKIKNVPFNKIVGLVSNTIDTTEVLIEE